MTLRKRQTVVLNRHRQAKAPVVRGRTVALNAVSMPTAEEAAVDPRVWVEVTEAGDYRGYPGGAFKFDKATFETIIANFRKHPSYKADAATGVGLADVVPWDFHHASEFPPSEGTIPVAGAPAQGWIQDLAIRQGADGTDQLWALTRWLEPARSYIKEGRYKWASVVVDFAARDGETNEKLGPTLISVAITNNPFVEGMTPLVAASKDHRVAAGAYIGNMYCEPACSAEDAYEKLRSLFGLASIASVGDVLAELAKVQEFIASGNAPLGVQLDEVVGGMRMILNLPALSSTEEVFVEAGKLLGRLLEEAQLPAPAPAAAGGAPPPPALPAPPAVMSKGPNMLIKILASKLGVRENDDAVVAVVENLLQFRAMLAKACGVDLEISDLKLLESGKGAGDARSKLTAILDALGVPDSGEAINKIAKIMEDSAKLTEVMPELSALRTEAAKVEDKQIEEDVEQAMASKGLKDEGVRVALRALRKNDKEAFFKANPKSDKPAVSTEGKTHLTSQVATNTNGGERRIELNDKGEIKVLGGRGARPGQGERIKLSAFQGRNRTEKLIAYLQANGMKDATREDLIIAAGELIRQGKVEDDAA